VNISISISISAGSIARKVHKSHIEIIILSSIGEPEEEGRPRQ